MAESDLIDVVLTFEGASFVEPVFALPENFNVSYRRTTAEDSAVSATSIGAAGFQAVDDAASNSKIDIGYKLNATA